MKRFVKVVAVLSMLIGLSMSGIGLASADEAAPPGSATLADWPVPLDGPVVWATPVPASERVFADDSGAGSRKTASKPSPTLLAALCNNGSAPPCHLPYNSTYDIAGGDVLSGSTLYASSAGKICIHLKATSGISSSGLIQVSVNTKPSVGWVNFPQNGIEYGYCWTGLVANSNNNTPGLLNPDLSRHGGVYSATAT